MTKIDKNRLYNLYINKKMTLKGIGKLYNISHSAVAKKMDKYGLKRRNTGEAAYVYHNKTECFHINKKAN